MTYQVIFRNIEMACSTYNRLSSHYRSRRALDSLSGFSKNRLHKSAIDVTSRSVLSDLETVAMRHNFRYRVKIF